MEIDHGAIKIDVEPVQLNSSTSFIPAVDAECEAVSLLDMTYPYSCKFCNKLAEEPVLNIQCGHLFCWRCVFVRLKYELELNQSCPCCQTRLDFSAVTGNLIPVRTGPVPGEEFDLRTQLEPVFGEEEEQIEKALIEASISRGEGYYVRPRPLTLQGYYGSLSHFHCTNLMRFTVATSNICNFLVSLCKEPHDLGEVRVLINRRMDHLIHEFLVAWKWLTGLEYPELPEAWNKLDCPQLPEPWNEKLLEQTKAISVKEYVSAEKKRRVEEKVYLAGRSVVFSDTSKVHTNASSICKFSCTICSKVPNQPFVSLCGHLFCWSCIHLNYHSMSSCPCYGCPLRFQNCLRISPSRACVNPIRGTLKLPKELDEFLIVNGASAFHIENDDVPPVACSFSPVVSIMFLKHTINEVNILYSQIRKKLEDQHTIWKNCKPEDMKNFSENMQKMVHCQFAKLLLDWRMLSGEKDPEEALNPCLIPYLVPKDINRQVYKSFFAE